MRGLAPTESRSRWLILLTPDKQERMMPQRPNLSIPATTELVAAT
jgi:hypothetical protein